MFAVTGDVRQTLSSGMSSGMSSSDLGAPSTSAKARALARHKGQLDLSGLTTISDAQGFCEDGRLLA